MKTRSAFILCVALVVATPGQLRAREVAPLASYGPHACLPPHRETSDLVPVGLGVAGRQQWLQPDAARAWRGMQRAAKADGVSLLLVSAFRSVNQQRQIFERKLRAGQTLEAILAVNVPPGFSQHHAGTAVDLGTPGNTSLLEDFEKTTAFRWLRAHARDHGFSLSYPRGNPSGLAYEPWHWAFGLDEASVGRCRTTGSDQNTAMSRRADERLAALTRPGPTQGQKERNGRFLR